MTNDMPEYNIGRIYDLLVAAFTGKTLRRLLRRNPTLRPILTRFGPEQGLDDMADEVIEYCEQQVLLHELLVAVSRVNPGQYATHYPSLGRSAPAPSVRTDARVTYHEWPRRYWMIALAVVLIAGTGVVVVILRSANGLPVPTPIPTPIIERFDVDPLEITEGETVRLSWQVIGADTVSIDPLGREVLLQGDMSDQPKSLTTYRLTARKIAPDGSEARDSISAQVIVNPATTPTPEPQAPIVQFFEATPTEIVAGSRTEVMLTWSVSGNTTDIQIIGAGVPLAGLGMEDSISLSISDEVFFVLTAYNGELSSSKHVQIRTVEPTPTPLDTPVPPTPQDSFTPTWTPTVRPTSTYTPTPCPTADALFLDQWLAARDKLGCAEERHLVTWIGEQAFENGWMYWRKDTDMIYAVYQGGTWEQYANSWHEGDSLFSCPGPNTPSESPPTPHMGFGKIWCDHPLVRQNLGWALESGDGFDAPLQRFQHGLLLRVKAWTWALYDDSTWEQR